MEELCRTGGLTTALRLVGEILGMFLVAPLWLWSTTNTRPVPLDATVISFTASLVCLFLYISSFSLHINSHGEFAPHPSESCVGSRRIFPFILEIVSVAAGDIASLFEEARWSDTHLLGGSARMRALSDMSTGIDLMERGEDSQGTGRRRKAK